MVDTITVSIKDLHSYSMAALASIGMNKRDAQTIADKLTLTDSWGIFTHGNKLLGDYITRIQAGGTNPIGKPRIASEGPAWAIVDGDNAAGQIGCDFAMRKAIDLAKSAGNSSVPISKR